MRFYSTGNGVIRRSFVFACVIVAITFGSSVVAERKLGKVNRFAADMAEGGNWREAQYRWAALERDHPDNPRLLGNLAVAAEAVGERDKAFDYYERALVGDLADPRLLRNFEEFSGFWSRTLEDETGEAFKARLAGIRLPKPRGRKKANAQRVEVGLPVPPRLKLEGTESILVISFLTDEMMFLDVNREIVRYLRSELRKNTRLSVLEITPAPAVPEQTIEDLIANDGFWKFVAREFDADIVVSGQIGYMREDVSGFREVDRTNPNTGQKVRRTEFVDQEEFGFGLDLLFMNGKDGSLLIRDKVRRKIRYTGSQNDPITAFYEMSESMTGDILSIVNTQRRPSARFIFRD
ncbi:MAG: tetratricopeptide repeat protein [Acidobacteriota bacterium]|nr:tetratricopeptide repeat protein [Acidobacteriota bacterium]MDH3785569.1 tetratricopeptide repeat protein [Acidobacteriota bacterium]